MPHHVLWGMFERVSWQADRMILDGFVFRIDQARRTSWDGNDGCFRFYKTKPLIDQYETYFRRHAIVANNIFELGLWDGGSLAFWCEVFHPKKIVGIDIEDRADSAYFQKYVAQKNLSDRIRTHWNTSQTDRQALLDIVRSEFTGPLDLVFDDASHLYEPTKISFETLFPLLRPGGLYVIEDWAWHHWEPFERPKSWNPTAHLTRLIFENVEAVGTNRGAIASVTVAPGFVGIERGEADIPASSFHLRDQIFRRRESTLNRMLARVVWGPEREALSRLKRRVLGRLAR